MPSFILESKRLLLRPPSLGDVADIASLIGDWDVAKNLSRAPFPYLPEHALDFIRRQEDGRARATDFAFAVTRREDGALIGMCGVHLREEGFELGYWLGKPYWKKGYATEATAEVLAFSFRNLRAETVEAGWFHDNPASGRVLEKLGFRRVGSSPKPCVARGEAVLCNLVAMSRAAFGQRNAA